MRWAKRFAATGVILATLFVGATVIVQREAKGQSSWLNAAQLETLRLILNTFGVAVWPNFTGDPFTCNSNVPGAYYFNTSTNAFRVCDGTSWADGGGGVGALNDLSDVTLTGPANDEIIRFNSGSGDWENAAQSASNIGDLGDVVLTAPANTEILQFNGADWVNVAGASPSTIAGLTDTVVTSPAEGEELVHDGANWVNTQVSTSFALFPFNFAVGGHAFAANQVCATDNDLRVFRHTFPQHCDVSRVVWGLENDGTNCNQGAVALYALDGNTKVLDSGAQTYSASNTVVDADIADVFVTAGSYWVAYTSNECSTACTVTAVTDPTPTSNISIDALLNTGNTMLGTSANQSVAGAMPATLGVITANDHIDRPLIKFVCTDP